MFPHECAQIVLVPDPMDVVELLVQGKVDAIFVRSEIIQGECACCHKQIYMCDYSRLLGYAYFAVKEHIPDFEQAGTCASR